MKFMDKIKKKIKYPIIGSEINYKKEEQLTKDVAKIYYVPQITIEGNLVPLSNKCNSKEEALIKARESRKDLNKKVFQEYWNCNKKRIYKNLFIMLTLVINWNGIYQLLKLLLMYFLGQLVVEIGDISWIIPAVATSIFSYLIWKVTKMNFEYQSKRDFKEQQSEFVLVLIKLDSLKTLLKIKINSDVVIFDNTVENDILFSKEVETIITRDLLKYLDSFELFDVYLNNFINENECLHSNFEWEKKRRMISVDISTDKTPKKDMGEDTTRYQNIVNEMYKKTSNVEVFLQSKYEEKYGRSIFTERIK